MKRTIGTLLLALFSTAVFAQSGAQPKLLINNVEPKFAKDHYISGKDVITVVMPDNAPEGASIQIKRTAHKATPVSAPEPPVFTQKAAKDAQGRATATFSLDKCNCWEAPRPGEYVFVYIDDVPNLNPANRRFVLTINPEVK